MSLWIDVDNVVSVLLADGWHEVEEESFTMDSYEFHWRGDCMHGGGGSGICATGFSFVEQIAGGTMVFTQGPLTAILAIRQARSQP